MYIKARYRILGGHTHVTIFIGIGREFTKANAGTIVVRNEEFDEFQLKASFDEWERVEPDAPWHPGNQEVHHE